MKWAKLAFDAPLPCLYPTSLPQRDPGHHGASIWCLCSAWWTEVHAYVRSDASLSLSLSPTLKKSANSVGGTRAHRSLEGTRPLRHFLGTAVP